MSDKMQDYIVFYSISLGIIIWIGGFALACLGYKDMIYASIIGLSIAMLSPLMLALYNATIGK